jgi:methionine-rich copper-binding protein CopC
MRMFTLGLAAAIALSAGAASAHPKILATFPGVHASVAAPHEVRITFSEAVLPKLCSVMVMSKTGAMIKTGPLVLAAGNNKQIIVPITGAMAPGAYEVTWRAVSADTHRVSGKFDFQVK